MLRKQLLTASALLCATQTYALRLSTETLDLEPLEGPRDPVGRLPPPPPPPLETVLKYVGSSLEEREEREMRA